MPVPGFEPGTGSFTTLHCRYSILQSSIMTDVSHCPVETSVLGTTLNIPVLKIVLWSVALCFEKWVLQTFRGKLLPSSLW